MLFCNLQLFATSCVTGQWVCYMLTELQAPASFICAILGNSNAIPLEMQWSIWLWQWSQQVGLLQLIVCGSAVTQLQSREAATQLIMDLLPCNHVSMVLMELLWLPLCCHMLWFTLYVMMPIGQARHTSGTQWCLSVEIHLVVNYTPTDNTNCAVCSTRTTTRALSVTRLSDWNTLTDSPRSTDCAVTLDTVWNCIFGMYFGSILL